MVPEITPHSVTTFPVMCGSFTVGKGLFVHSYSTTFTFNLTLNNMTEQNCTPLYPSVGFSVLRLHYKLNRVLLLGCSKQEATMARFSELVLPSSLLRLFIVLQDSQDRFITNVQH